MYGAASRRVRKKREQVENPNSLLTDKRQTVMNQESKEFKEAVRGHSDRLAKMGAELGEIRFSYKIEEKTTKEYWQHRMDYFKRYNDKGMEYYNQVHAVMNLVSKKEAQMFLLRVSRFRQLCVALLKTMEKIRENPSIINSKDKQQSLWSKEIKDQITHQSNECLQYERDMNMSFRVFYEKQLKEILE